jgi:hypothetical protein
MAPSPSKAESDGSSFRLHSYALQGIVTYHKFLAGVLALSFCSGVARLGTHLADTYGTATPRG